MGLAGIVSKRLGSRYRLGRSPDWLKFKNPAAPAVRREAEEDWRLIARIPDLWSRYVQRIARCGFLEPLVSSVMAEEWFEELRVARTDA